MAKKPTTKAAPSDPIANLQAQVDALKALMRANGWTVPK